MRLSKWSLGVRQVYKFILFSATVKLGPPYELYVNNYGSNRDNDHHDNDRDRDNDNNNDHDSDVTTSMCQYDFQVRQPSFPLTLLPRAFQAYRSNLGEGAFCPTPQKSKSGLLDWFELGKVITGIRQVQNVGKLAVLFLEIWRRKVRLLRLKRFIAFRYIPLKLAVLTSKSLFCIQNCFFLTQNYTPSYSLTFGYREPQNDFCPPPLKVFALLKFLKNNRKNNSLLLKKQWSIVFCPP